VLEQMQAFNVTQQRTLARVLTVADSFFRSLIGLMGRPGLEAGHGLWIVPCQSVHTFWMRFPIDVVFLDQHHTVIHLVESLRPFRISKHLSKASSVIELPVGAIRATGTQMGDEIQIAER
ncbi:MAG: DUF192 domain-containing protein, partial [Terriglobia bacterium]